MQISSTKSQSNDSHLNNKENNDFQTISLEFLPTLATLPTKLVEMRSVLFQAKKSKFTELKISTNSGLILLLIPLIVPLKDRLKIEFNFEVISIVSLFATNYESSKNFKDILEASLVLQNLGFEVMFNKSLPKT